MSYQVEGFETRATEFFTLLLESHWESFLDQLRDDVQLQKEATQSYESFIELLTSAHGWFYHECLQLSYQGCDVEDTPERQLREDYEEVVKEFG